MYVPAIPFEYKWPRSGSLYTGIDAGPASAALTGLGSCRPCGQAGLGAIPNENRDGAVACRDGAPVGFVGPITRFSRNPGSREIMAIISVACPGTDDRGQRLVREVALPLPWVWMHLAEIPLEFGTNRAYLEKVLSWVGDRGAALTMQQIREELAQEARQQEQLRRDTELAARQAAHEQEMAARGHDESAAARSWRQRYIDAAARWGIHDVWAAAQANVRLSREIGWVPLLVTYAGGAADPQIVIDAAEFQQWLRGEGRLYIPPGLTPAQVAVDGKVGPKTTDAVRIARRAQMAGTLSGDVPRLMLSLVVPGLEDPLTAPALPVGQRPQPAQPAEPAAPVVGRRPRGVPNVAVRPEDLRINLGFREKSSGGSGGLLALLLLGAVAASGK